METVRRSVVPDWIGISFVTKPVMVVVLVAVVCFFVLGCASKWHFVAHLFYEIAFSFSFSRVRLPLHLYAYLSLPQSLHHHLDLYLCLRMLSQMTICSTLVVNEVVLVSAKLCV